MERRVPFAATIGKIVAVIPLITATDELIRQHIET
jgi:hypothetical protein